MPEVERRVSNVIALFGLKVGGSPRRLGMTQSPISIVRRGELPVGPVFLRELIKALRTESKLAGASAYAARLADENRARD
jgi:hypothetical protein